MSDVILTATSLGKRYQLGRRREKYGRLTESLAGAIRAPFHRMRKSGRVAEEPFWALRDVAFELKRGEVIGVIGRNGAGKTTLLKILSRITEPTTGEVRLRGRVGSLLEVGTGFHPELTGRENIYMCAAILGMRRREIAMRFDEIVQFAGTEMFLDTPVKRYSSGMQVRLGFAVAAHLDTEILVIDEVLAVGDAEFQRKCLAKMDAVSHDGRTIVFVSHNMAAIESLCGSAMLLREGAVAGSGDVREIVKLYLSDAATADVASIATRRDRQGDGRLRFVDIEASVRTGSPSTLRFTYVAEAAVRNVEVRVGIYTIRGETALWLSTEMTGTQLGAVPAKGAIVCSFDRASLVPGRYTINLYAAVGGAMADYVTDAAIFDVAEGDFFGSGKLPPPDHGLVLVQYAWSVEST